MLFRSIDNGEWLSNTRYRGTYDFTAQVPPGNYQINVKGAKGADGIDAASGSYSFTVVYGGGVTVLPPLPPTVVAQNNASLTTISANWQSSSPNIDQYRYAIGTTAGARNVVGWTYLTSNSIVRSDLNLTYGQTYYVTVQAHNTSGQWSANGVRIPVIAGVPVTPTPTPMITPSVTPGTGAPSPTPSATPTGRSNVYLPMISH